MKNTELNDNIDCERIFPYTDFNEDLLIAILNDSLEEVKSLVEQGADVNYKDEDDDWTPLMYAILSSVSVTTIPYNLEIIKYLIDKGADVNTKNENGETALEYAIDNENLEITKILIENGADVNFKNDYGITPLMKVCCHYSKESCEIAKLLIDNGADVNAKDSDGKTPLMEAAKRGLLEIVKLLIDSGVDMNAKDNDGKTALMYAKNLEMKNCLKMAMGKRQLSQKFTQSSKKMMPLIDFDCSDFNQLKNEVEKYHEAIIKTMDLSLALQKRVSDLQEDSFLNAQHINAIKFNHQKHIDKIYNILRKHITDTDNFIMEFVEEYDKENNHIKELKCKQKGFICRFFDRFTRKP